MQCPVLTQRMVGPGGDPADAVDIMDSVETKGSVRAKQVRQRERAKERAGMRETFTDTATQRHGGIDTRRQRHRDTETSIWESRTTWAGEASQRKAETARAGGGGRAHMSCARASESGCA
eukprot:434569-Rhodomonas_salina.1